MKSEPHLQPFRDDEALDVKRYFSLLISNWYWFGISWFIAFTLAYGTNKYAEKIYSVSSSILIKDEQIGGSGPGMESFIPGGELFKSKQNLRNEIGILQSFALSKRVIDSLPFFHVTYSSIGKRNIAESRMYNNSPFIVIPADSVAQPRSLVSVRIISQREYRLSINSGKGEDTTMLFGDRYSKYGFDFKIRLRHPETYEYKSDQSNKFNFYFPSLPALANQYRRKLSIKPIDDEASILSLSLTGPVAAQESDYLNKLMQLYIHQGIELKNRTADSTISFIDRQVAVIDDSLQLAEEELLEFRDKNSLVDISREGLLIQTRLEQYESEKNRSQLQLQYYIYLKDYLSDRTGSVDLISPAAMGVTDPQLVRLIQELSLIQHEKRQLLLNLKENTMPLKLLEKNLLQTKAALTEIVDGGIQTLNSTLEDIDRRIAVVDNDIRKLPLIEREYIRIQRKFDLNNTVYTFLLEKRAEAGIAKASSVSDNRIIDNAQTFNSSLIRPLTRRNYMMAIILGFLIPVAGIVLIDYFNNKIMDRKDVEKRTTVPVLGYISHNASKSELPVHEKPGSTLSESFRSVRTNLGFFTTDLKCPIIAVSSTISSEGKTFISINLATIIASLGKRVLLVGLDLRKPRIHKVLGIDNTIGVSTYLSGGNSMEEVIRSTIIENLFYAPAGPVPPNPAELIESEKMKTFFQSAREQFDFVIIDTPPIAIVTDAMLIEKQVDMYLLVVRQRYTSRNTLDLIEELYQSKTLKKLGIVINDITLSGYYGYGLRYGYNLGYSYTYGYNYYNQQGYGGYGSSKTSKGYYTED
jgi:tyrosine-protein kinase Etk/Wzc